MSALPPKADMLNIGADVCFVPLADIVRVKTAFYSSKHSCSMSCHSQRHRYCEQPGIPFDTVLDIELVEVRPLRADRNFAKSEAVGQEGP